MKTIWSGGPKTEGTDRHHQKTFCRHCKEYIDSEGVIVNASGDASQAYVALDVYYCTFHIQLDGTCIHCHFPCRNISCTLAKCSFAAVLLPLNSLVYFKQRATLWLTQKWAI
jgi:hypothetical protein